MLHFRNNNQATQTEPEYLRAQIFNLCRAPFLRYFENLRRWFLRCAVGAAAQTAAHLSTAVQNIHPTHILYYSSNDGEGVTLAVLTYFGCVCSTDRLKLLILYHNILCDSICNLCIKKILYLRFFVIWTMAHFQIPHDMFVCNDELRKYWARRRMPSDQQVATETWV